MFFAASWLILLLALSITGLSVKVRNSPITLPVTRRLLHSSNGTVKLLQHDRARAAAFRNRNTHSRRAGEIPGPSDVWVYTAPLGLGNPPTTYNLIIDSGSSNTWVGASTPYKPTNTSIDTQQLVEVTYTEGASESTFSGTIYLDSLAFTDRTVTNFPIGVASSSNGFLTDGILGIGPEDLTLGTLINLATRKFPTFTSYMYSQDQISEDVVGIAFQPAPGDGEIMFGGVDPTNFTGDIAYTPITETHPASDYWGIDQSITYDDEQILDSTAGIIDTGSAFISIADDAYAKYQAATGAVADEVTGLLAISSEQFGAMKDLTFHIGGQNFTLTPNAQIWPRALNTKLDGPGVENAIYLIITNIGSSTGEGLDFINGYTFIQRFYTVLDTTGSRVGFAPNNFHDATTN